MGTQDGKIEFRCIGVKAFIGGYSNIKGDHLYFDTINKRNPLSDLTLGLCPECRKKVANKWFESIVPPRMKDLSFETFDSSACPKVYKAAKAFDPTSSSLIFFSNSYGTGKTHLAVSIIREYLQGYMADYDLIGREFCHHKIPVSVVTESEIIDKIKSSYDNDSEENESDIIHKHTGTQLLLLDDVGKVTFAKDDFLHRIYFLMIDRLYNNQKNVILTCNGGLASLSKHIGEACVSRLYEMCGKNIYEVAGKDYRREAK